MKKILTIMLATLTMTAATASAQNNDSKGTKQESAIVEAGRIYIYGVAISPSDSIVYMTDELMLENIQIEKKTRFLVGRSELSQQLRDHMSAQGEVNRICSVTFSPNLNKLDKQYKKQLNKFMKRGFTVKNVSQADFRFQTVRIQ